MTEAVATWTKRITARIDRAALDAIGSKYTPTEPNGVTKYLELDTWIAINVKRALGLGLHTLPPRRILDLGTGCGYFPFVCRAMGHGVTALDHPKRSAVYRDTCALLGVPVVDHVIQPMQPLPDLGVFDIVTAYMVTFNGHQTSPWGVPEWDWFIEHAPAPRVLLELNREPPPLDSCYPPGLHEWLTARGAEITGHWPHTAQADGHRVLIDRR
jgi:hypothetical protein